MSAPPVKRRKTLNIIEATQSFPSSAMADSSSSSSSSSADPPVPTTPDQMSSDTSDPFIQTILGLAGFAPCLEFPETSLRSPPLVPSPLANTLDVVDNDDDSVASDAQNTDVPDISSDLPSPYTWPADRIPVEIFNIVVQYLPRRDIQMMRLVNREFDAKLSEAYFSVVVVPFRPEFESLYGQLNLKGSSSKDDTSTDQAQYTNEAEDQVQVHDPSQIPPNDGLISAGHRVFEQFGDKMRKFALALEINENDLANPPLKITQEIHAAPWGLYRWPIMTYQRFAEVEGLERLANETGYMFEAFTHLKNITEIGISCDAGLGWLYGPDGNRCYAGTQPSVFRPTIFDVVDTNTGGANTPEAEPPCMTFLKQMAANAGYPAEHLSRVILRLLEDEGRAGVTKWIDRTWSNGKEIRQRIPSLQINDSTPNEAILSQIQHGIFCCDEDETYEGSADTSRVGQLVPSKLSQAQSEMLLELEWAHRALMQSFRLALLNNKNTFQNLTTLNIARCPSSRITTWCSEEFWETMTSIQTFHLGVIPDWRQLRKQADDTINQWQVTPSNACHIVFKLLQSFVGEQKNIKNISFEWVCGGEFATGKTQRDRYILPAPVLSESFNMMNVKHTLQTEEILNMPYVSKLSLKNCWFSPHVFTFFFEHMFLEALENVVLESVSLSGPASLDSVPSIYQHAKQKHWPWPLCAGAEPGNWFRLRPPHGQQANQPAAPPPHPVVVLAAAQLGPPGAATGGAFMPFAQPLMPPLGPAGLANPAGQALMGNAAAAAAPNVVNDTEPPAEPNDDPSVGKWRAWSWPHVLARLGMAPDTVHRYLEDSSVAEEALQETIKADEQRFARLFKNILLDRTYQGKHQAFKFKSCGYVVIDWPHINNWEVVPRQAVRVRHTADYVSRITELDTQMLSTEDFLLAKIINYMPDEEVRSLRNLFNFELGWDGVYEPIVKQAALADGNPAPGEARFSGGTNNKPTTIEGMRKLLARKGKQVQSYLF